MVVVVVRRCTKGWLRWCRLWAVWFAVVSRELAWPYQSVYLQDGKSVVSGSLSDDNTVRVWDAATGKEVQKLEGHSSRVSSVAFSPVGGVARAPGSCGRSVRGWCVMCVCVFVLVWLDM